MASVGMKPIRAGVPYKGLANVRRSTCPCSLSFHPSCGVLDSMGQGLRPPCLARGGVARLSMARPGVRDEKQRRLPRSCSPPRKVWKLISGFRGSPFRDMTGKGDDDSRCTRSVMGSCKGCRSRADRKRYWRTVWSLDYEVFGTEPRFRVLIAEATILRRRRARARVRASVYDEPELIPLWLESRVWAGDINRWPWQSVNIFAPRGTIILRSGHVSGPLSPIITHNTRQLPPSTSTAGEYPPPHPQGRHPAAGLSSRFACALGNPPDGGDVPSVGGSMGARDGRQGSYL